MKMKMGLNDAARRQAARVEAGKEDRQEF